MTTARDLVQDALIEIGAIDPIEVADAKSAAHGFRVLTRMLDQWSADGLMVYTVDRQTFNLTATKQSYTLGAGGDFNVSRPVHIHMASVQDSSLAMPVEIPLQIATDEEWRNVSVKATPSTFPTVMWVQGDMPTNTLWFWPIPASATYQVILYTWGLLSLATLDTAVNLPKGYEEAIVTNLALRLATSYGKAPDPMLLQRAGNAKSQIESLNLNPLYAWDSHGNNAIRSFGLLVD